MDIMRFKDGGHLHFIGCGGAGTQPLMKIFHELGFRTSGSDLAESAATRALEKLGLPVRIGHHADNLPPANAKDVLVVHSSAAGPGNPEIDEAARRGWPCMKRGEALARLAATYKRAAAVSGSHGKTSVTAMLAHILKSCGANPGYLVGGAVAGWDFNGAAGNGDIFVCEVDESDGTHALMKPHVAIVTNVEDDHCWSVGGVDKLFCNFKSFALNGERLIYVGAETPDAIFASHPSKTRLDWNSLSSSSSLQGVSKRTLSSWGAYQKVNAGTAVEAAVELGLPRRQAEEVLDSFLGVDRRMSIRFDDGKRKVVEDYAHHPTELAASLSALRETHPGMRLTVVFQPHRYARLERYIDGFAEELRKADAVFVTPVFAAWTASGKVDSATLAAKIGPKANSIAGPWDAMAAQIASALPEKGLLAIIGAGDLKELIPHIVALLSGKVC